MGCKGRVVQINLSRGGVPKMRVDVAHVRTMGIEGDAHDDLVHHGGIDRAVSAFSLEVIQALAKEGHPIAPGTTGENLTIAGLSWAEVVPGAKLVIGAVKLEVMSFAPPCNTIQASFVSGEFRRISHKLHPEQSRVYLRVLHEGTIHAEDPVRLISPNGV